jgi:hypothetical protein
MKEPSLSSRGEVDGPVDMVCSNAKKSMTCEENKKM